MREILFRGKLPDDGEWVEGYVVKGRCTYILTAENIHYMSVSVSGHASVDVLPVNPKTIGQYTGLKDKNGRRIFEGDILSGSWNTLLVVYYDDIATSFKVRTRTGMEKEISYYGLDRIEVIGNIHDNPELLKDG